MTYLEHLQKDKNLAPILGDTVHQLKFHPNIALRLMAAIISQQLNTRVAAIIYNRFLDLYDQAEPTPQQVMATGYEQLRSIGLSHAKANYLQAVAAFCTEHDITDAKLLALSDEEIVALLTRIKGVGKWTCQMLLMFTLGREDVFPLDDLGIQQGMIRLFNIQETDKKKRLAEMERLSLPWRPFRTYAALHLWAWKDGK